MSTVSSLAWKLVAVCSLVLASFAAFVPIVPAVPFLLLAAVASERGWPWLERRLMRHPAIGLGLAGWRERGALPRAAKFTGSASMLASAALCWASPLPAWVAWAVCAAAAGVTAWLWTRPS